MSASRSGWAPSGSISKRRSTGTPSASEEWPALDVFYKETDGAIYRTFGTYARGLDILLGTYNYLDMTPKGRHEQGHGMSWLRHHDRYRDSSKAANACCEAEPGTHGPASDPA